MKAVLWGYRYDDMKETWARQMVWLANALKESGYEVVNKGITCTGLDVRPYEPSRDNPCDVVIYNHIDLSDLTGNVVKADRTWFFKPTVPDEVHTTLDPIGYGPFSSISFDKPDFESVDVGDFFETQVKDWIESGATKYQQAFDKVDLPHKDYWLVLGQCGGDSVNTRHDFGDYFTKLRQVIGELSRIDKHEIVVKLHPYTDGKFATDTVFSDKLKADLEKISPKVHVYNGKVNIHNFIAGARAVILGNSGSGFEAMMHHKPIIAWGKPEYHWIAYDLRYLADLVRAIKLDWFNVEKQDKYFVWYLNHYCFYDQITASRRVWDLLGERPDFDALWKYHRPAQGYQEYKAFFDFISTRLPKNPVVVEIGLRHANQRWFYKALLNADYKGIDINKFDGPDFIQGDSKSPETLERLKRWLQGRRIDLLFIDGDHKYEGVMADHGLYGPLADIVVFHDINTTNEKNADVKRYWRELNRDKVVEFKIAEPGYGGDGIGVLL